MNNSDAFRSVSRVFHAAHLLDGGVHTVGSAAGAAFGNALKRYTGLSPTELRACRGAVEWLLQQFPRRLEEGGAGGPEQVPAASVPPE